MADNLKTLINRISKNRIIYFSQIFIATLVAIDYSLTQNISHVLGGWFYIFPASGIAMATLPLFREWEDYEHKYLTLVIGHMLVGAFLILLTDIFGPYFQILVLLMFSSIYWFGWIGFLISLLLDFAIIALGSWQQYGELSASLISLMLIHFLILTILGVLFERVHTRQQNKGEQASKLIKTVSFERSRLLSLINSMADAVVATDSTGRVLLYNGAVLDLLNTNISIENQPLKDFLKLRNEKGRPVDVIKLAHQTKKVQKRDDLHFINNEGQKTRLYLDISPIRGGGTTSKGEGFIMLLRDITKEKSLDEERTEFISVTSHELRTPIAIAEANISTALMPKHSKGLSKEIRELLDQAYGQILFLSDLVNDLTTLARAERGDLDLEVADVKPAQILKDLAENYEAEIKAKNLTLKVETSAKLPQITTSPLYVREILQNFLTNAIKYTPKGAITISAKPLKNGAIQFSVQDSGIGISAADKKRIFEKFYRAEDYRTRATRGTGLGLYITAKIASKIKGKIWFSSKLNSGSTFYLKIKPLKKLPKKSKSKRSEA